ncbi:MAG: hypothetical protein D6761_09390 [Candidatus Dadabacteria bacterium]|nr:MAG: hypothetical protein D6761_09390 [Candidatus Dadabacteria bacterium]
MTDHYAVLDVPTDAKPSEIGAAYRSLRELYDDDLATYGLLDESERRVELEQIERAYFVLSDYARRKAYDRQLQAEGHAGPWYEAPAAPERITDAAAPAGMQEPAPEPASEPEVVAEPEPAKPQSAPKREIPAIPEEGISGDWLRQVREARGMDLEDLSQRIKITMTQLENIERERFDRLPAPVYLRGFLQSYARELGIDPERVVTDYLAIRERWAEHP